MSRPVVVTVAAGPAGAEGLPLVPAAGGARSAGTPCSRRRLVYGSVFSGSGSGYRDRDRRDSMSELTTDWSLPSSGISSSPAR